MPATISDLKIAVQEPTSFSRRLTITVPAERVEQTRGAVAKQLSHNVRLPGFRKGKIPARMLEQRYGPSIEQESVDRLIQEAYREALQSEDFNPITQGKVEKVEYEPGSALTFEVEFEVEPEIALNRLHGFTATRPSTEVGEDEVDSVLERLREDRAVWHPLEADAKPDFNHQVTVEITPLDPDGAPKDGGEAVRPYRFVLGEGQAIPDVEEAIMTLAVGQQERFTVRFPEDFADEAQRGQEQFLQILLTGAQRRELPDLDDEFAHGMGDFETLQALRERVMTDLREDAERRAEGEVRGQLVSQIVEANPFEVPTSMVDRYLDHMTGRGEDPEDPRQHTPEELERIQQMHDVLRPQAELGLKQILATDRIAEQEGLRATQDEIDARVEALAEQHGRSPGEVWIQLEKSGQLDVMAREITEDKVFKFLLEKNNVA